VALQQFYTPEVFSKEHISNLAKLYIFAVKICETQLMNVAITQIQAITVARYQRGVPRKKTTQLITPQLVSYIYGNTSSDSQLRKFALHVFAWGFVDVYEDPLPAFNLIGKLVDVCKDHTDLLVEYLSYLKDRTEGGLYWPAEIWRRYSSCYDHTHPTGQHHPENCRFPVCIVDKALEWRDLASDEARVLLLRGEGGANY
jgi:hypothetical protein